MPVFKQKNFFNQASKPLTKTSKLGYVRRKLFPQGRIMFAGNSNKYHGTHYLSKMTFRRTAKSKGWKDFFQILDNIFPCKGRENLFD